jgi:hypothetical protein
MKKINQISASIFNKLVALMGENDHLKIDNSDGCFMPIVIEKLGSPSNIGGQPVQVFSLTHYFKQNGDSVPDPDMTFAQSLYDNNCIWALTYQDQLRYDEAVFIKDGHWVENKKLQNDLSVFSGQWLKNIKDQQEL